MFQQTTDRLETKKRGNVWISELLSNCKFRSRQNIWIWPKEMTPDGTVLSEMNLNQQWISDMGYVMDTPKFR
jgi:hypothetical protein